eukprot:1186881-Prorocentrum_minimum.AAC.2
MDGADERAVATVGERRDHQPAAVAQVLVAVLHLCAPRGPGAGRKGVRRGPGGGRKGQPNHGTFNWGKR